MSRSNKARYTRKSIWKDTVLRSRCHARTRSRLKKVTKHSPKKTAHSRKPQKPSVYIITGSGIYDSRSKCIEPFDDD